MQCQNSQNCRSRSLRLSREAQFRPSGRREYPQNHSLGGADSCPPAAGEVGSTESHPPNHQPRLLVSPPWVEPSLIRPALVLALRASGRGRSSWANVPERNNSPARKEDPIRLRERRTSRPRSERRTRFPPRGPLPPSHGATGFFGSCSWCWRLSSFSEERN